MLNISINQNTRVLLYAAIAFFVPLLFGHLKSISNQLMIGTIVNLILVVAALQLTWKQTLPIILLPSIAAFASGIIFSELSIFLLYLIPFIWLGNTVFVYVIKRIQTSYFKAITLAAITKTLCLIIPTLVLVNYAIIPSQFIPAMGIMQLTTAMLGGIFASVSTRI
ncbi:MAG: hypothetical protein ABH803_00355 [Candidatus Micrarchaeota archaeon]